MFQSFSGTSRRPRQVNLSGQDLNPFAASSWAPTASGTQKTVAAAQQERQQRQRERERLNAAKRIQRTWRGHKARQDLAASRRLLWDEMESRNGEVADVSRELSQELRLLLTFYDSQKEQDTERLSRFCGRLLEASQNHVLSKADMRPYLRGLAAVLLVTLEHCPTPSRENILFLLPLIIQSDVQIVSSVASKYYEALSSVLNDASFAARNRSLILNAIRAPLTEDVGNNPNHATLLSAHLGFALEFLTTANLTDKIGGLQELAQFVHISTLGQALLQESSISVLSVMDADSRLWLLAHYIALHNLGQLHDQNTNYVKALSILLSYSANDIYGRVDSSESHDYQDSPDDDANSETSLPPLPQFIREQLTSLVNRRSITELLDKFNTEYTDASQPKIEKDGSLLASYALILLRTFPTLGEEIRMWLYQGSVSIPKSNLKLPAIKLFWKAMSTTTTFAGICNDTRSALNILRGRSSRRSATANEPIKDDDWKAILLFLELYAFILRFTDDEEFLSGGEQSITDPTRPLSRSQENALPLVEVKRLTVFLKNLSFTMYFHAGELAGSGSSEAAHTGLSTYFGAGPQSKTFTFETSSSSQNENSKSNKFNEGFLGIAGMTFDYVRGIATRVMRMLYERDSRRRFLPKDHWLMTSKFDMEGFIPAVVAEEERRHQAAEVGEEQHDDDEEELVRRSDMRFGNRLAQMESLRKQQQRMARKNALAAIGPRLEVLQNMPYVIPFKTRVQIFRQFVYQDQLRRRNGAVDPDMWRMSVVQSFQGQGNPAEIRGVLAKHHAKIRRDNIFEDAFDQFYTLGEGLKEPIQITFVDQFDTVEAGIDGGGVTKEFLTSVTSEAFRPSSGGPNLFITNDQNLLYPNPAALDERKDLLRQAGIRQSDPEWSSQLGDLLRHYEFLGRVVGKCLYEGILVDIGFAGFFLLKWASSESTTSTSESRYQANINDLRDLDESLYQGLLQLKNHPGNVEDFSLDFTINDIISSPGEPIRTITRELLPNGSNIPVTNENRVLYVSGVARHRLHLQPFLQTRAFLRGLGQIINPSWLSMFNQAEIQTLIGGTVAEIDVEDLRRNTIYSGVYMIGDDGLEHPTIKLFWQVMKELDDQDRRKVLKYVTSTPRAPLLGFAQLNPRFSIRDAGSDEQRLPSASTCINLLKLPRYTSASTLRQKLVYAVNAGAGFDLS